MNEYWCFSSISDGFVIPNICFVIFVWINLIVQTIVTLYGPAMALSGETPEAVTSSVSNMRGQQDFVFKVGGVAITSLFLSAICLSWARRPRGVASVNTFVYLGMCTCGVYM